MELGGSTLLCALLLMFSHVVNAANPKLFRVYIGAESQTIRLSDVPINSEVEVHFILAFAIDYVGASPTNGNFNVFWGKNLSPSDIASIKAKHPNVKVALSLGGDTAAGNRFAYFDPKSISSWVQNAVSSLARIIKEYHLDGIDIDYEHFKTSPSIFAECIGQLITRLKKSRVISFASIAPYEDNDVKSNYMALWRKYAKAIDYVNFQFYAYERIGVSQFQNYFDRQASNYGGGQMLASFIIHGKGGLHPNDGFFEACKNLRRQGKLGGIFIWCADESIGDNFQFEKKSQAFLAA